MQPAGSAGPLCGSVPLGKGSKIRANPWPRSSLSLRHRCNLILAQFTTDALLRPEPVPKYFPAPRTSPLREPPPTRQVHSDPGHQDREVRGLSQLHFLNRETQKNETEEKHDHKIATRHVAVPRPPIVRYVLRAALARCMIGLSSVKHKDQWSGGRLVRPNEIPGRGVRGSTTPDSTVYSPSACSDRNNRKSLYQFSSRTTRPSPAASAAGATQNAAP